MDQTVSQELHSLSMADLVDMRAYLLERMNTAYKEWTKKDDLLFLAVGDEIRRRIDLIKSKI